MQGLIDLRMSQVSSRRAAVDEVLGVRGLYSAQYSGWNVKHFHTWYAREHQGTRSYSWVKNVLQEAKLVVRSKARGKHRKKRERKPLSGMMVHQDASTHQWVPEQIWDLVVTLDDATSAHTSMFFCTEEGTDSSFHGIGQTMARHEMFCSLYTDRGSHYFHTAEAGGKVDKLNLTQVGRALRQLGIEHIAAYSPEARGRSERAPSTRTRGACPGNWPRPGSPIWMRPIATWNRCTCPITTLNLHSPPQRRAARSCPTSARACPTFCARSSSARWATTTA
jgi:hypothetical protein